MNFTYLKYFVQQFSFCGIFLHAHCYAYFDGKLCFFAYMPPYPREIFETLQNNSDLTRKGISWSDTLWPCTWSDLEENPNEKKI